MKPSDKRPYPTNAETRNPRYPNGDDVTAAAPLPIPSDPQTNLHLLPGQVRPHTGRGHVLTEIAARYSELIEPLNGPDGVRGDGASPIRMPRTYTPTVKEFERLVVRLRDENRPLWWHLNGWHLSATSRTMHHCPRCGITHQPEHVHAKKNGPGLMTVKCKRVVVYSRRAGARESLAKQAIQQLADWWGLDHEPMLPVELRIVD